MTLLNQPKKISDEFFDKNKKLLFLEPYQKIDLEKLDNIKNNYNFWQNKFSNISKEYCSNRF